MQVELSKNEIKTIQKCLMSVIYTNMVFKLGDDTKLTELHDKLERLRVENK